MQKKNYSPAEKLISDYIRGNGMYFYRDEIGVVAHTDRFAIYLDTEYEGVLEPLFPDMCMEVYVPAYNVRGNGTPEKKTVDRNGLAWMLATMDETHKSAYPTKSLYEEGQYSILRGFRVPTSEDGPYWIDNSLLAYYGKTEEKLKQYTFDLLVIEDLCRRKATTTDKAIRLNSASNVPEMLIVSGRSDIINVVV